MLFSTDSLDWSGAGSGRDGDRPWPQRQTLARTWLRRGLSTAAALGAIASCPAIAQAGSQVTSTSPGSPVTPSIVDVVLYPDDPTSFGVEVDVGQPTALDVYLLNDMTGSFTDDLPNVRSAVPALTTGLKAIAPDLQMGLGTFADKPIYPFGGWFYNPGDGRWYQVQDYVYRNSLALTSDPAALQAAANDMAISYGGDLPESQLEALLQVALRSQTELGFRANAFKTVIVQTDAVFHYANDPYRVNSEGQPLPLVDLAGNQGQFTPNNGDATIDLWEDYPAIGMVRDALLQSGIVPIFAVTNDVMGAYQALVAQWGFGQVVELNRDSSNLTQAVRSGIQQALSDVKLFVEDDDFDYVQQVASDESSKKAGVDRDVPTGDRAKFTVSLADRTSDPRTGDDTLYLTATGYGRTTVHVTVPTPTTTPTLFPTTPTPIPLPSAPPSIAPSPGLPTPSRSTPESSPWLALAGLGLWGLVHRSNRSKQAKRSANR